MPLTDEFSEMEFWISPRFGTLIEGAGDMSGALKCILMFRKQNQVDQICEVPPYERCISSEFEVNINSQMLSRARNVFSSERFRSQTLYGRVKKAALLGLSQTDFGSISKPDQIPLTNVAFKTDAIGMCLEQALSRFALLLSFNRSPSLNIGLHVPTDSMHAWIEMDGNVLFECEDSMIHYQTAVRFYADQHD